VETVVLLRHLPKGGAVSVVQPSQYDGRDSLLTFIQFYRPFSQG